MQKVSLCGRFRGSFLLHLLTKNFCDVFDTGLNSKVYSENGIPTGEVRAVARFSTESGTSMKGDPTYNLFIYGLSDSNNEFMGKPVTMYADSFISDMLYLQQPEASKAMVAVTMWMQVANRLHSAYGACKNSFLTDGRSSDGRMLQTNDPGLLLDEAAGESVFALSLVVTM